MRSPTRKLPESNEKTDEVHFEQRSRQASDERRSNLTVVRREEAKPNAVCQNNKYGGIAQLARASALQAEGRRFDSDYLHKKST